MVNSASNPRALVGWIQSLGDPTRLRLMHLLERNELGVLELCDILQLPQSTVSRHLKVLADQHWVRSRKDGVIHLYGTILDELEPAARKLWLVAREQTSDWPAVHQDELRLAHRLRNREINTQAFFASAAGKWDKLRRELYGEGFITSAMLSLLPRDYVVTDLGCGTGSVAGQLAPNVGRVIGIDSSTAMLKAARKRLAGRDNITFLRGDLTGLPLADGICDAALLLLVLTYVADIEPVLTESRRILKPAGRLIVVDLLPHDRDDFRRQLGQRHAGLDPEQLKASLAGAGFPRVATQVLPPEPAAKGPALFLASAAAAN
jgi:SAM-dependent methyltransferase